MKPNITPVQVHEKANYLHVQLASFQEGLPTAQWAVGLLVEGKPAIPAKGVPGHLGFEPEVPAVKDAFTAHSSGTYTFSKNEWDGWSTDVDDEEYVREVVANALGYILK